MWFTSPGRRPDVTVRKFGLIKTQHCMHCARLCPRVKITHSNLLLLRRGEGGYRMIWANRQCCFLLLVTVAPPVAPTSSVPLAVCTVLEEGFCMLRRGFSAANVTSDNHLTGFDVDMRREVLAGREYTVRVMGTYGELQVRTRAGECDVGWAQFFNTAARFFQ